MLVQVLANIGYDRSVYSLGPNIWSRLAWSLDLESFMVLDP